MEAARRIITAFSIVIGVWILTSVAGAYFDPAHAEFWSGSLMWSLLASLLVAPALVMIYDTSTFSSAQTSRDRAPQEEQATSTSASRSSSTSRKPFVDGASGAYPVSEEPEEHGLSEEGWPDWVEGHSAQ